MGKDPYKFRRSNLKKKNQIAVLDKVAKAGSWGKMMPEGFAQGIAFHDEYKSCTACLVELYVMDSSEEPGGAGELGVPAAVGANANAYARATGIKPRKFPINFEPFPAQ